MNEDRKQELANLLNKSLAKLAIKNQHWKNVTLAGYKALCLSGKDDDYVQYIKSMCEISAVDNSLREKLLDFFRVEFGDYTKNDKIAPCIISIRGGGVISLDHLIRSLWRISFVWGVKTAISVFEKTIEEDRVFFQDMIALNGLKIEREIQLFDGVRLVPMPNSSKNFPCFVPDTLGLDRHLKENLVSKTLLVIDCSVYPAFSKNVGVYNEFNQKQTNRNIGEINIYEFCMILAIVSNLPVRPYIKWIHVDEKELFFYETGVAGRSCVYYENIISQFLDSFSAYDINAEEFANLYTKFLGFDSAKKERLIIAIPRWVGSKTNKGIVDKVIDLGIAFEHLYLDESNTTQLSYTFCMRVAWHLGKNAEHRNRLFACGKAIYDCRSKAVHTAKLPTTIRLKGESIGIQQFIEKAQDLCRQSIMKIIQSGRFPDWDSLVVGENATQNLPAQRP